MDLLLKLVLMVAVVAAVGIHTGDAVKCYVCNSGEEFDGTTCADPLPKEEAKAKDLLRDCDDEGQKDGKNYTMCRKFLQDVEGDSRIVRTCASAGRVNQCVDRTGTTRIKLRYCECEGNECNVASTVHARVLVALSAVTLTAVAVFRAV
jgi:hypothetical protein